MPLLTCSRAGDRGTTDLLGEIKAVNRLSEKHFPSCTVALLSQVGPFEDLQRVTIEIDGPPAEVDESATWYCARLRERGVVCDRIAGAE